MTEPQDIETPFSVYARAWLEARGVNTHQLSEYGVLTHVLIQHGYPVPGPGAGAAQNAAYAALAARHGRVVSTLQDSKVILVTDDTCPVCGGALSEPFEPGDPPVHEGTETDLWACKGIQAGRLSTPTTNETEVTADVQRPLGAR